MVEVTDVEEQIPEFLLNCFENPWIRNCRVRGYNISYLMLVDQSGNFIEDKDTPSGPKLVATESKVDKPERIDDIHAATGDPDFLFKLVAYDAGPGDFLQSGSGKLLVSEMTRGAPVLRLVEDYCLGERTTTISPTTTLAPDTESCNTAIWRLYKTDNR